MGRKRDRASADGLLPRMEARPWSDGETVTYRYHPLGGKPINLGTDKIAAIRKVLDINGDNSDRGTVAELWRLFHETKEWVELKQPTRDDYTQGSGPLLRIFGQMRPAAIKASHIRRYLKVERKDAPVRANREVALLSNLLNVAIDRGELEANVCRQVRRNKEKPRKHAPQTDVLTAFLVWAQGIKGQAVVLAGMAEFAALTGNRRIEFRELSWPQVGEQVVRLKRAKQRDEAGDEVFEEVGISPALANLIGRLRAVARDDRHGWVFPNAHGNAYTDQAFKLGWNRLMKKAMAEKVFEPDQRFTFHDLRAYYVTQHKALRGALPDLHANPATTAKVYDRTKTVKREAL